MGINKELIENLQDSVRYHTRALEIFRQLNDSYLVLLCLRHLITLNHLMGNAGDEQEYTQLYNQMLKAPEFRNLNPELLFRDSETRFNLAKEITVTLQRVENSLTLALGDQLQRGGSLMAKSIVRNNSIMMEEESGVNPNLWRIALRLRLLNSIKASRILLRQLNPTIKKDKDMSSNYAMAIRQMEDTIYCLDNETNEVVLEKLRTMQFTKEATNQLRGQINRIRKNVLKIFYGYALRKLRALVHRKNRTVVTARVRNDPTKFFAQACAKAASGQNIVKCNLHSNGRSQKFLRITPEGTLRWADSESEIKHSSNSNECKVERRHGLMSCR
jgi:hypothetical protein